MRRYLNSETKKLKSMLKQYERTGEQVLIELTQDVQRPHDAKSCLQQVEGFVIGHL
jgi:hypothetical protein